MHSNSLLFLFSISILSEGSSLYILTQMHNSYMWLAFNFLWLISASYVYYISLTDHVEQNL